MAIFSDCSVVLDLKNIPFKEKRKLMTAILDNGGNISYVVNQKCSFVVANSLENISSNRRRSAQKHRTPVVDLQYVWRCLEKGLLVPVQEHVLKPQSSDHTPEQTGLKSREQPQAQINSIHDEKAKIQVNDGTYLGRFRLYKENDHDIPEFSSDFQVAKYSILAKAQPKTWSVLELQSAKGQAGRQYRVVSAIINEAEKRVVWDKQVHSCSSEDAVEAYLMLSKELEVQSFSPTQTLPPWAEKLTSHGLQQLLLEEKLSCSTVSQEVGVFLELLWGEAFGSLRSVLTRPVNSISLSDVSRAEGLLLQVQKSECDDEVKSLLEEVNTLLSLRIRESDSKNKLVSQQLDLCQLIRDILNITEVNSGSTYPSSLGKYRALRCSIEQVPSQSPEFLSVCQLLEDRPAQIQKILRVSRGPELHMFRNELGNIKPLLHSTAPSSLVGILSRGLLLPRVGVEQHGIERTDIGNLGSGIYFSDSFNTSVKYSKPSVTDGCRLLLVCEVALGQCKNLHKRDFTLTSAPEGYNSVHGVRRTPKTRSDFEDDEYVVYNTDQIRLKYVVQYILTEDELKDFQPSVNMTPAPQYIASSSDLLSSDDGEGLGVTKNPLEEVTAGLLDSNGQTLPLQAVHVRCKLMDLLSQVVIFQTYTNNSIVPIEAKYVFPLEETAAVCGFEAFINGKHVIGKVKEKEQARKEYRQAIEKGHGAYLMDQDAPDVFTISVGNLPPGATVLIKVTFITELVVRAGTIVFSLPASVAPWQQSSALNKKTQTTVEKVCVSELQPEGEFSLCMSIEMPYEILNLECSHQIKFKRTDCKAVVSTLPDQTLGTDGFQLSFTLSQIHMPRMWVEKHPEKDTEACMLVFYPHFESSGVSVSDVSDVIIVLDTSESMRGDAMLNARRIALKVLNSLDRSLRVNIISFGSDYKEAFPSPNLLHEAFEEAKNFIMTSTAVGGSTELWRPLRTLNLLPPSRGVRNVLLISDGHVQNQPQTLQLVRDNVRHTRLFTCGLNLTANRYMLRALAQAGGGTYEFFDTKAKHTWAKKVNSQVRCMVSPGCSSVAVKWQQFNPTAPSPVQAPSQLHALFSNCHTLVYGFVPHCTQATLFGELSGQEIETMVSTTELQKTKGTLLHKLTARAIIRDYEDGSLGSNEAEHEGKKAELKSYIIELSKEFSILSQFTSFVAIEERGLEQPDSGFTDVPKIIAEEDVDILSYMGWTEQETMCMALSDRDEEEEDAYEIFLEETHPREKARRGLRSRWDETPAAENVFQVNNKSSGSESSEYDFGDYDSMVDSMVDGSPCISQDQHAYSSPLHLKKKSLSQEDYELLDYEEDDDPTSLSIYDSAGVSLPADILSAPAAVGSAFPPIKDFNSDTLNVINQSARSNSFSQVCRTSSSPAASIGFEVSSPSSTDGNLFEGARILPRLLGRAPHITRSSCFPPSLLFESRASALCSGAFEPPPPPPSISSVDPSPPAGFRVPAPCSVAFEAPPPPNVSFGEPPPPAGFRASALHRDAFETPPPPSISSGDPPPPAIFRASALRSALHLGARLPPPPPALFRASALRLAACPPPPPPVGFRASALHRDAFEAPPPPPPSISSGDPPPPAIFGASGLHRVASEAPPPPPPSISSGDPPPPAIFGASGLHRVASEAPPPPPPSISSGDPPPPAIFGASGLRRVASEAPPPPPPPSISSGDPPPPAIFGASGLRRVASEAPPRPSVGSGAPAPLITTWQAPGSSSVGFGGPDSSSGVNFEGLMGAPPVRFSWHRSPPSISSGDPPPPAIFGASGLRRVASEAPPRPSVGSGAPAPLITTWQAPGSSSVGFGGPDSSSGVNFEGLMGAPPVRFSWHRSPPSISSGDPPPPAIFGASGLRRVASEAPPRPSVGSGAPAPLITTWQAPGSSSVGFGGPDSSSGVNFEGLMGAPPVRFSWHRSPPPNSDDLDFGAPASLAAISLRSKRRRAKSVEESSPVQTISISELYRRPDRINWEELFNLQHQDGYWECTGTLSRFLGLDVDFFANVFLKERGICSLGAKAHADILKLVATLLVLQLMRVMKMTDGEVFQSLFRLTDDPEPRPACWEAVKRAVEWVCWADRQYPCMCSRLELGWDWESCTRQLLGLDSPPPFSPLIPVLQRSSRLPVM
ncbi:protein mono-ADP-ribosyltransferase PARP4 isoform X2 [Neoarius graeffei]|uniref:protein mono-ADP-ribosyltransferase PARP4 isoform X2 n=1 Tax=Neoarius graeffei TaxID=443677 RepID=UPI00298CDA97|nr:protein mono-ADP-ribosyltransferase PARP4 isoform X2 [Neoarius graeffei]